MTVVVKCIEAFREGLFPLKTEVALMSVRHLAMLVSLRMAAELTFYSLSSVIIDSLLYQAHIVLTHYLSVLNKFFCSTTFNRTRYSSKTFYQ